MEAGGEGGADGRGPPLSESHAPKNRRLSVLTRRIWRKRGKFEGSASSSRLLFTNKRGFSEIGKKEKGSETPGGFGSEREACLFLSGMFAESCGKP